MALASEPQQDVGFESFGKYRLIQPLTQGGMAELFLAKQQGPAGFEKTVVIKRVLRHLSEDTEFVQMFLDEARLAAQLSHPNIVQIFDFGEADGCYFLAMEQLIGEDVGTVLRAVRRTTSTVPPAVAASILAASCDALHYAHTLTDELGRPLSIVHRDVSPSNLYVTFRGVVKVLDFGIAKAAGKVTQTRAGMVKGKFPYMSPEQAKGLPLDGRSDVFALGIVLHELLTGKRLFSRDNDLAILKAVIEEPIPRPSSLRPEVPKELDDIAMKALERDLEKRFASAGEMHEALDEWLTGQSSTPSANQLQKYMLSLFGEEHIQKKLKPPTVGTGSGPKSYPTPSPRAITGPQKLVDPENVPFEMAEADHEAPTSAAGRSEAATQAGASPEAPTVAAVPIPAADRKNPLLVPSLIIGGALVAVAAIVTLRRGPEPVVVTPAPAAVAAAPAVAPPAPVVVPVPVVAPVVEAPKAEAPKPVEAKPAEPAPKVVAAAAKEPAKPKVAKAVVAAVAPKAPEKPQPAGDPGTLNVNCVPWCRVYLDGKDTGKNSPAMGLQLSPGAHTVKVVNPPSGSSKEKSITIESGKLAKEIFQL